MTIREEWEATEAQILSSRACPAARTKGRLREEPPCPLRTCFQRDRDRVIHSKAFRRLKHKTQVLLLPEGDHLRTRLTHTLEVSQIARTISRALRLNEDLTEAIALAHDLGHTPFGHMGERVLNRLAREAGLEGFHHAQQSLRVVDHLEKGGKGLNLTWEVRMGILQHSKGQVRVGEGFALESPSSLEAWVVRVSDSIAYLNHDLDDALRARLLREEEIPDVVTRRLGKTHGERICRMVEDVVASSGEEIRFGAEVLESMEALRAFLLERVYAAPPVKAEEPKVAFLVETLFRRCLKTNPQWGPREVLDHISGMTDRYALQVFERENVPRPWPENPIVNW